jgi:PAS domain S-box-containing protein
MPRGPTPTILHVDDDAINRESLGYLLRASGFSVQDAATGAEALRLATEKPDVILLDVCLPDLSGLEVCRRLKSDPATARIPILQFSALRVSSEDRSAGLEVGADAYLAKPVEPRELIAQLNALIRTHRIEEELRARVEQQAAVAELSQRALGGGDLSAWLEECVRRVAGLLGVDYCEVLELLPEGKSLLLRVGVGWRDDLLGRATVPSGAHSHAGYTLLANEPVLVEDLRTETRFQVAPLLQEHGVVSGLSAIIRGDDRPFGVLGAHSTRLCTFSRADVDFLQAVANLMAAALHRQRMEEKLQASEATLRLALDSAAMSVWDVDLRSGWPPRNSLEEGHEKLLGIPVASFPKTTEDYLQLIHPDDREAAILAGRRAREERSPYAVEFRVRWPDGSLHWLASRGRFIYDETGQPVRMCGLSMDVTERKRADETLRWLAAMVESSDDAIVGLTPDGVVTSWNPGAARMYGYTAEEVIGRPITLLAPPDRVDEVLGILGRLRQGKPVEQFETVRIRKDGKSIHVSLTISPIRNAAGAWVGATSIGRNVSERKALEEQLRQAQKMEAVGHLAGGIAHDFNNLLTVITGYSDLLLGQFRRDDPAGHLVQEIRKAGERAASLTRQLLAFSRKAILQPVVLDFNAVVEEMDRMCRRVLGADIDLATSLDPNLGKVKADPGQIQQMLLNLVVNARDAMPSGGRLRLATHNVELDEDYARRHLELRPGAYVMLVVSDTGSGMPPEVKARLFEPFFTTKEVGKGTGLGLAMVHGVVKMSNGHIEVDSEPGRGTTFRIYLPRLDQRAGPSRSDSSPCIAPTGKETVLLAEDEEGVRKLARMVLESNGYKVLVAGSGSEALQVAAGHEGPLHLLITDVIMPQLGGRQLADLLIRQHPGLRVLYISGYTDEAFIRPGLLQSDAVLLQKPFTPTALARKVREVLDSAGNSSSPGLL